MKKEIADIWVAALRSGEYLQGKGMLEVFEADQDDRIVSKFCCLGVLSKLADKAGVPVTKDSGSGRIQGAYIDPDVRDWAGMIHCTGDFTGDTISRDAILYSLPTLNDKRGYTFDEIADVIEKNWKRL